MQARFDIDPDVSTASTLDKAFYLDAAVWALARERCVHPFHRLVARFMAGEVSAAPPSPPDRNPR